MICHFVRHSVSLYLLAHHLSNYWRMTLSVAAEDDISLMLLRRTSVNN